ncbi:DUF3592 domain-containing protein [Streptomyces sp. NPDC059142]|uniref:DUF3592 domain-containing protein n=1 Tax=Streptomyces sp. NPDC059142 TaxID=3346739 RepID=UPI0036B19437
MENQIVVASGFSVTHFILMLPLLVAAVRLAFVAVESVLLGLRGSCAVGNLRAAHLCPIRVAVMAKFTLDDGRTFRCHGRYRGMAAAEIGDEVEVIYDPGNPKRARVAPVDFGGG